jgi:murein L,D-transpeptidase YcbB/YkuD
MIRPLVVGLLLLVIPGRDAGPGSSLRAQDAMAEALAVERPKAVEGRSAAERDDLDAIYERAGGAALWIGADRRPTAQARAGLRLLAEAATQGLDPAAYGGAELAVLAASLDASSSATTAARFDTRMTAGVLRYFRHLHLGRVDPRTLGHQLTIPVEEHDFVEIVCRCIGPSLSLNSHRNSS